MQGEDFASAQAVAANAVPAAEHLRRDAEVLGDSFDCISGVNFVTRDAACIRRRVTHRMLAGRDRDDQFGVGFQFSAVEVIGFGDRFGRGVIIPRKRGERVAGVNRVIAPPQAHVPGNRIDRRFVLIFGSGGNV